MHLTVFSYPERNFDENQLLSASIGLSPLIPTDSTDLRVRTPPILHLNFSRLQSRQYKINAFRVLTNKLILFGLG